VFADGTRLQKNFVDLTASAVLNRVDTSADLPDTRVHRGQLAVCRSVMLTALNVSHGDRILVDHPEDLAIRFVLPRPGPPQPPD